MCLDDPATLGTDETDAVDYHATAATLVVGVGGITGQGVFANATVSGVVEAFVGAPAGVAAGGQPSTILAITGATTIRAMSDMDAVADADGFGAGAVAATIMIPSATVSGETRAYAGDGADITGTTLVVSASADLDADATTIAISVGGAAGQGADATAVVSGIVDAHVGPAASTTPGGVAWSIVLTGSASISAISTMDAMATADGGGGGVANVAIMLPNATVSGTTRAYLGEGADLTAASLSILADATRMVATATSLAVGIGALGSGTGHRR